MYREVNAEKRNINFDFCTVVVSDNDDWNKRECYVASLIQPTGLVKKRIGGKKPHETLIRRKRYVESLFDREYTVYLFLRNYIFHCIACYKKHRLE